MLTLALGLWLTCSRSGAGCLILGLVMLLHRLTAYSMLTLLDTGESSALPRHLLCAERCLFIFLLTAFRLMLRVQGRIPDVCEAPSWGEGASHNAVNRPAPMCVGRELLGMLGSAASLSWIQLPGCGWNSAHLCWRGGGGRNSFQRCRLP